MNNKIFVGSLPFSADSTALESLFAAQGQVLSAKVIVDRSSGRSKGFGFVEMSTEEEAKNAIEQLNGQDFMGRPISVSIAKPQEARPPRDRDSGGYRSRY